MNNKIILPVAFLFYFIMVTHVDVAAQNDSTTGKIYFMRLPRETFRGLLNVALNYSRVFIDSTFICNLDEKRFFAYNVSPGRHRFSMRYLTAAKEDFPEAYINIEPGKNYYLQFIYDRSSHTKDMFFKQLSEEHAILMLQDLREDKSCYKASKIKQ